MRGDALPALLRNRLRAGFQKSSQRLGAVLSDFDRELGRVGLSRASAGALADFGVTTTVRGKPLAEGPGLFVANHPGAYDALCVFSALGRDDVLVLAADRPFLRALCNFSKHVLFVSEAPDRQDNHLVLLRARRHLARGGAILQFAAGRIEPDPAFVHGETETLGPWHSGTGLLAQLAARAGGNVQLAMIRGVHSPRAKWFPPVRLAESYGITTLAPLLQVALRTFRDVRPEVLLGDVIDARDLTATGNAEEVTERLRSQAGTLARVR